LKAKIQIMNKLVLTFGVALSSLFFGCQEGAENESNDSNGSTAETSQLPTADGPTLLYEITGNDLEEASYLFGTIHMIPSDEYFMPASVDSAMSRAKKLVLEIDMDDPAMMMEAAQMAMMGGDTSIEMFVSEQDYVMLDEFFSEEVGIGMAMFKNMKPFFVYGMLAETYLDDSKVYERELMNMASAQEKEVYGLESLEFVGGMIDQIPLKEQADMLVEAVMEYDSGRIMFEDMITLYKAQDVEGLYQFVSSEMTEYESFEDLLLSDRNSHWIENMKPMMEEGSTFFGVGAGHLGGPNGLLILLEEEGYSIRPIK
jgi:hypothetical protein